MSKRKMTQAEKWEAALRLIEPHVSLAIWRKLKAIRDSPEKPRPIHANKQAVHTTKGGTVNISALAILAEALTEQLGDLADTLEEAMDTHIYDEANGEKPGPDCQYQTAINDARTMITNARTVMAVDNKRQAGLCPLVSLHLQGGLIQAAGIHDVPENITIEVRDYDTDGATYRDLLVDPDGEEYVLRPVDTWNLTPLWMAPGRPAKRWKAVIGKNGKPTGLYTKPTKGYEKLTEKGDGK